MAGENNNLPVRSYQKEFKEMLQAVFGAQSYFGDFFSGGLEALDGVQHNAVAFSVKTSDVPVVIGNTYDKGANVAFGSGTGNSTRFGERTEIIYTDTDVPYSWEWRHHEGIDRHTVNNGLQDAIADRLELQAQAKTRMFNRHHSDFIATSAGHAEALSAYTDAEILKLFDALAAYFVNIEAMGTKVAKVNTSLYNNIVNHQITTTAKNSGANVDTNGIIQFKGFLIEEIPDEMFKTTGTPYAAYAYISGIGKAFTGINTARTIEAVDFDGVALQGAGKAGEFVLSDNKAAIVKVTAPTTRAAKAPAANAN